MVLRERLEANDRDKQRLKVELSEVEKEVEVLRIENRGVLEEVGVLRDAHQLTGQARRKDELVTKFLVPDLRKSVERSALCLDLFKRLQRDVAQSCPQLNG